MLRVKIVDCWTATRFKLVVALFLSCTNQLANAENKNTLKVMSTPTNKNSLITPKPEKRLALVIGNNAYKQSKLTASINDARGMAKALKELNFEVVTLEDVGRLEMLNAVRKFSNELSKSDSVGLFYFAGHGVQSNGKNFLLPIDAEIRREDDIGVQSVDIQYLLDKLSELRNGMNIVILDACRNNPFAPAGSKRTSGLAAVDGPPGTIVAFAAAPGKFAIETPGGNGVYTKHVLANIQLPGLPIEEVFKRIRSGVLRDTNNQQVSWENTSLLRDFYFSGAQPGRGFRPVDLDIEADAWGKLEDSRNVYDFIAFARRFPQSQYQPALLARINSILSKMKPAPPPLEMGQLPGFLNENFSGIGLRPLNIYSAEYFGRTTTNGMLIAEVTKGSVAEQAGLRVGDIILEANSLGINTLQDAQSFSKRTPPGEYIDLNVWRNRAEVRVLLLSSRAPIDKVLGRMADDDLSLLKEPARARTFYQYLADQGDLRSATRLGLIYAQGIGVARDVKNAELFLSKAARGGQSAAVALLAELYFPPSGIANEAEAFRLATESANAGIPEGANILAAAYFRGVGTTKNPIEAVRWSRVASAYGLPAGMFILGISYENGVGGLSRNVSEAKVWLKRARDLKFAPAAEALNRLGE